MSHEKDPKNDAARPDETGSAKRLDGIIPDTVRKALVTGLGALFMTEESIRGLVQEMRLPKEAAGYLIKQADAAKDQVFETVSNEIRKVVESINIGAEIQRVLSSVVIEVKTEIRLVPAEDGLVKPKVSTSVQARRVKRDKGADGAGNDDDE